MNRHILSPEVQRHLRENEQTPPSAMALRRSPFPEVSAAELAQQLDGRQRCRKKLPLWYDTPGIYYPAKLSVEQASSQVTASHKAHLVPAGARIADLTGGLGIDAFFFAQRAKAVTHCETDGGLSEIAAQNAAALGAANITFITADGPTYLRGQPDNTFDAIYIDPSRRVEQRKVFRLEDCQPDVVATQHELRQKAPKVIVKSAPLLDVAAALHVLKQVSAVHIVSVGNECKELLFVMDRGFAAAPTLVATALKPGAAPASFAFTIPEEKAAVAEYGHPVGHLYEPDAALLKAGGFKLIGARYGLKKLHRHTHLYTATERHTDFIGKTFRITDVMDYAAFKKNKTAVHANVSTRNFPLRVEELRKRHRIGEDGDHHLFFCTGPDDGPLVIFASKC